MRVRPIEVRFSFSRGLVLLRLSTSVGRRR